MTTNDWNGIDQALAAADRQLAAAPTMRPYAHLTTDELIEAAADAGDKNHRRVDALHDPRRARAPAPLPRARARPPLTAGR